VSLFIQKISYRNGWISDSMETCSGGAKRHRKILRDNIQGITKVSFVFGGFDEVDLYYF
jgi:hypothetical protein